MSTLEKKEESPLFAGFLLMASVAYVILAKLPRFNTADAIHSDHTIVGLQALHFLRGEWHWFLWGCDYQASFEPMVTALVFAIFGPSTQAILAVSLAAMILVLALQWRILRHEVSSLWATLLVGPTVLASNAYLGMTIAPPRQWCYVAVFVAAALALWAVNENRSRGEAIAGFIVAPILAFVSLYIDFYAIVFFLPLIIFIGRVAMKRFLRFVLLGVLLGGLGLMITRSFAESGAPLAFSVGRIARNLPLFWKVCFPNILGCSGGFILSQHSPFFSLRVVLAWALLLMLCACAYAAFFNPWGLTKNAREIAIFGHLVAGQTVLGFLGSSMASDAGAIRYLVSFVMALPFACLPIAFSKHRRILSLILGSYILVTGIEGWSAGGPRKWGIIPTMSRASDARQEKLLLGRLQELGISAATSDYWSAYRFTFLWKEKVIVVPRYAWQDRYRPYRTYVDSEKRIAHLIVPGEPEAVTEITKRLRDEGVDTNELDIGKYRIVIEERPGKRILN